MYASSAGVRRPQVAHVRGQHVHRHLLHHGGVHPALAGLLAGGLAHALHRHLGAAAHRRAHALAGPGERKVRFAVSFTLVSKPQPYPCI